MVRTGRVAKQAKAGDVMAVLEIPELRMQLDEDQAEIRDVASQMDRARNELDRVEAQSKVANLEYTRLDQVAKSRPGLVAHKKSTTAKAKASPRKLRSPSR